MVQFIADHRAVFGVEPICAVLPIAPSTYRRHRHQRTHPTRRSARAQRDDQLRVEIQRVYDAHQQVYGPRKVWKQRRRDGVRVARCTVARLMRAMGLAGAVRGRAWVTTTHAGEGGRPVDLVDRRFVATRPNQLWVSDFTYVATWGGFVYVAFVIDVCARRIVGWRVSASMRTDCVLDALEQAIYARRGDALTGLVHHSDAGSQYLSMRYTDRLVDAGIAPSVGSQGDAYDCEHDGVAVRARPNQLWVSDFTYVATWGGFVYVAFVIDVCARRIVGWRVSASMRTDFVLDALEQAIYARRGDALTGLVHHSDAGSQYLSMRYTDRLVDAGIAPSVGSQGDAYDNALAESVIGVYKTEVIRRKGPWRTLEAVEFATLTWVDWFNTRRLLGPLGDIPPAELEAQYYEQAEVA